MRRPDFPLAEAAGWFLTDKAADVEPTTLKTYGIWIGRFIAFLLPVQVGAGGQAGGSAVIPGPATLADLTLDNALRFTRQTTNRNTRMNQVVALRSFARYLAETSVWYDGDRRSVLRDLKVPQPSPYGVPPYTDVEVRQIIRAAADGDERIRAAAVIAVLLHGLRAKEARALELRNIVLPVFREQGHLRIEYSGTKRRTRGVREVPLEAAAVDPIRDYIRLARPRYIATTDVDEPLFLTIHGHPFTRDGWNDMARRIKTRVREAGISFRQHRLRSTSVRMKREAGWPDSAIIQVHGWSPESGQRMLRRYGGEIPTAELKRLPSALDRVLGVG